MCSPCPSYNPGFGGRSRHLIGVIHNRPRFEIRRRQKRNSGFYETLVATLCFIERSFHLGPIPLSVRSNLHDGNRYSLHTSFFRTSVSWKTRVRQEVLTGRKDILPESLRCDVRDDSRPTVLLGTLF